ncbi:hypothetical protein A9Q95_05960 [Rhodobacterales bacterium 59_46_T64]|nr:hypothetical protein A9Q95_05960 [Rhodobacterales bacterium 59_46_T64]
MRLVCPNCGAQYEVPEDVIPENGRDVQCSSCGDTWFQQHPDQINAAAEEAAQAAERASFVDPVEVTTPDDTQEDQDDWTGEGIETLEDNAPDYEVSEDSQDDSAQEEQAPFIEIADDTLPSEAPSATEAETDTDTAPPAEDHTDEEATGHTEEEIITWVPPEDDYYEDETGADEGQGHPPLQDPPAPPRRELDPSVAELLREEAARETRARAAENGSDFESQGDLGLEEPSGETGRREREVQLRMARMRGEPEPAPEHAATVGAVSAVGGSRRDLLPDIEEINSTLRSSRDRRPASADDQEGALTQPSQKRGFLSGFGMTLLITVVLIVIYANAGRISAALPVLAPVVNGYAAKVDDARAWLDDKMVAMMTSMDGMAGAPQPAVRETKN